MPPLTARDALTVWQFAPLVTAALAVAGGAYLAGAWRVGRRHPARPWPRRRTLAFLLGLAVVAVASRAVPVSTTMSYSARIWCSTCC